MKKIILGLLVSMLWLVSPNNVMAAELVQLFTIGLM